MELNTKIIQLLRKHTGGEAFFDALDLMIRGDADIITQFISFIKSNKNKYSNIDGIIMSGEFGRTLISEYLNEISSISKTILLCNGGIRKGSPVQFTTELPVMNDNALRYIFIDDSYYSGKTSDVIHKKLSENYSQNIDMLMYVIYDGSLKRNKSVKSLFRYHNN